MKHYKLKLTAVRHYFLVVFIFTLLIAHCRIDPYGINGSDFTVSESFEYEVEVKNQKNFRLDAINGPIDITGMSGATTVRVWGERMVGSESMEDAESHLGDLKVIVYDKQNEVFVETDQPERTHGYNYKVIYHVEIPESWKVMINNINGEIKVYSINNNVFADVTNGSVGLRDIYGNINIDVTNGNIDSKSVLPDRGTIQLEVTNGQIFMQVPQETSADFYSKVTNGNTTISNLTCTNLNMTNRITTGTLGNGNGVIELEAVNGQIHIKGF